MYADIVPNKCYVVFQNAGEELSENALVNSLHIVSSVELNPATKGEYEVAAFSEKHWDLKNREN